MSASADGTDAVATGALKSIAGATSGTTFTWSYQFGKDSYTKEVTVSSGTNVRIVEPFVDNTGNEYEIQGTDTFRITTLGGGVWQVKVLSSTGPYELVAGEDRAKYWSPFPGLDCYPLAIKLSSAGTNKIKYTVTQVP